MTEWNIQSRAHGCQACGKAFVDKQAYHTLLTEERQQYLRQDICEDCWRAHKEGATERKGFISQWQGIYHAPPAAPPEPIQKESAEGLLRKLIDSGDPKHGPVCFILAVMLERKRLLKVKEEIQREGHRVYVYEQPKTGDVFTITDPNLQVNHLEEVQRATAELLAHGLEGPPPAAPAQEAAPEMTEAPESAENPPMETAPTGEAQA